MSHSASCGQPHFTAFRHVGLSGDFGGSYFLTKAIGYAKAFELYLTSEHISAERAVDVGIANHVVDDGEVVDKAMAFARWIAEGNAYVTARMKENFVTANYADPRTALHLESSNHRLSGQESQGEGFKAFAEGTRQQPFSWD